jgi:aspartyl-tRNA(Asn)/glutamyl-tRNA(Gln) amidotransferase subunit A
MMNEIFKLDLCKVADLIKKREVSAIEVTQTAIKRAEGLQPSLNAFIRLDAAEALEAASEIDKKIKRGETVGSLAGVPLAHKDIFYRKGKLTTCGSKIRSQFKSNRTSTSFQRLSNAGAVYLGGLNMSEFAVGPIGNNIHYGDCNNPWNLDHASGGSSSGSGAAVAGRIVYGALGSDTGGSIRIPSAMSGVVGLKPTQNRVSRYGLMPLSFSFDCSGPMARTVWDAARVLDVIAGHDPKDPTSSQRPKDNYEGACDKSIAGLKIGIPKTYFYDEIDTEVGVALDLVQQQYSDLGAEIDFVDVPDHNHMNLIWAAALAAEASTIHRKWLRDRPDEYGPMVKRRIEFGLYQPATRYLEAMTLREKYLREYCKTALANCDVLLTPTLPVTAPAYNDLDVGGGKNMPDLVLKLSRNTRPISYLGLPALSVPCGFSKLGLPIAFQLFGRPFSEAQLCSLGAAYQNITEWHHRVPDTALL